MIYDNALLIEKIKEFIQEKNSQNNFVSEVSPIREDIFDILRKESILLYYPLEDENVKGCHVERIINGEPRQFVFINTIKMTEEQTWTAAHELGHVWGVEKAIKAEEDIVDTEDIVNRFASELLFPEKLFIRTFKGIVEELDVNPKGLKTNEFVHIITHIMDYFCAPYKAVIRRFIELGMIDKKNEQIYIKEFESNMDLCNELQRKYYYTRIGRKKKVCSMEHVAEDIEKLIITGVISNERANIYKKMFKLKEEKEYSGSFVIGGNNEDGIQSEGGN